MVKRGRILSGMRPTGRSVVRASSHDAQASREVQKEFQLLGVQVAIPILDRESLIGVAVFDERLTGERLRLQQQVRDDRRNERDDLRFCK